MASKTLSTSTLSLKFMQNANRAKQLKEVELDRAEVKDEEKWEVSQEIRDSWGLKTGTESRSSEVHETSYLPFLFSETDDPSGSKNNGNDSPPKKALGRRVFNKRGEMVPVGSSETQTISSTPAESSTSQPTSGRKLHQRPVSISAASGASGGRPLRGLESSSTARDNKPKKSAREAIFENSDVGIDLRSQMAQKAPSASSSASVSATFLKPVGVDDPKSVQTASTTTADVVLSNSGDVIDGAHQKSKNKRARETNASEPSESNKKNKKKKKVSE